MYKEKNNNREITEMRTRKILCILQLPPPLHGASIMNSHVINSEVIRKNFSITVVNLQFVRSIAELEKFSFLKVYKAFLYGFKIVKIVITEGPDLIYFALAPTGFAFYRDAFYVFLLKLLRRKIVFHLHGRGISKNVKDNSLKKCLYKVVFKNTNVICLSKCLAMDISEVYKSTPFIVPNGIQVRSQSNKLENHLNCSIPKILYLSNYIPEKGILVLIDALKILYTKGYKFKARFIGAPSVLSVDILEKIIVDLNLTECIKVTGPLYDDEKNEEFQKADIFVLPTYYKNEAFPLVILEAFQFSLPVISTFEGGIPDLVIDSESGFLIEPKNAQALADKIAILLKNKNLRISMGKKGNDIFRNNYTLNHFENNMNKTFQEILSTVNKIT
jgi:glycosyltransferase involved in cell wall biosynthesis